MVSHTKIEREKSLPKSTLQQRQTLPLTHSLIPTVNLLTTLTKQNKLIANQQSKLI